MEGCFLNREVIDHFQEAQEIIAADIIPADRCARNVHQNLEF
jgi:hypothetical protein